MFVALEGIDNTGKSTLAQRLGGFLEESGFKVCLVSDPVKELPWGEWKKDIEGNPKISTPARAMLYLAARLDAVERVIKPALEEGAVVVADRYYASWFAYQITKLEKRMSREEAYSLLYSIHNALVKAGLLVEPDRVYLLTGDPRILAARGAAKSRSVYDEIQTQTRVQENFLWTRSRILSDRTLVVDVGTRPLDEICEELFGDLTKYLASGRSG